MSLWFYVVVGLLVVIAIIVLMKADSKPMRSFRRKSELITNTTYICMYCGYQFSGSTCPKCGRGRRQPQFGK